MDIQMLKADVPVAQNFVRRRGRLSAAPVSEVVASVQDLARRVRMVDLEMISRAGLGHIGGDYSVADILAALYGAVLNVDPLDPHNPDRDRFVLSKGHSAGCLYATLADCGFFPAAELATFAQALSPLNGHPNRTKVPGVETNTGPLGHGFPVAVGCAIAAKLSGRPSRTFVVLGDGELQEGSNWEAAMAGAHHRLSRLTAVIDRNGLQQGARTEDTNELEPLPEKWRSFGWEVRLVDGHDHAQLLKVLGRPGTERPVCVIAKTVKGKGVSFMEDRPEWHHKVPTSEQVTTALEELEV